ncbi:hypothetical protein P3T76_007058 [Phytophthora citrophthora]|uniref:Uncharacterized protein n=1 Tax=Phytophthora citrophthora TaxID=4793 RepID=A0AAD9GMA8_9STRA|nr:hypothetical protein P3T76_007058 [Phytophthora citrophthora]
MQASTQPSFIVQDEVFVGEPESDMEVELGVNLIDTFTEHQSNLKCQVPKTTPWGLQSMYELDACALLPAEACRNEDIYNSDLDDVEQEVLSKALLDDQDISMEAENKTLVVFLYAFEKFRMVYA